MTQRYLEQLFSPAVKAAQARNGSRETYARLEGETSGADPLTAREVEFLGRRDSFYMATIGHQGWPYLQHRGGPAGFVRVLDAHTIGFADLRGNRQYISVGNLADDDRVSLFFMDYPNRARLKILGRARIVDAQDGLAAALADGLPATRVERLMTIRVEAFDWNCPQYITPRYTAAEIEPVIAALKARIAELEGQPTGGR